MIRSMPVIVAVAGTILSAQSAAASFPYDWNFCSGTSFNVCMDFTLVDMGANSYQITFQYTSTSAPAGQTGVMTGAGLYRSREAADLNVTDATVVAVDPSSSWIINSTGLGGGGPIELEVFGSSSQGATNGVQPGGWVTIGFKSTNLATYNLADLYGRAHIQSFGPDDCSLKPDSDLGVVDGTAAVDERCGTDTTTTITEVPEPITMVLVGSGLLGLGIARRRRGNGDVTAAD